MRNAVKKRKWTLKYENAAGLPDAAKLFPEGFDIDPVCAGLIAGRCGYDRETVERYIGKESGSCHDPFLLDGMREAVDRINLAVARGEVAAIFGDYDVDGVTSVSILYLYLRSRGMKTGYFIPARSDGYGMNTEAVDRLKARGVSLIITVDTGITANEEIAYASSLGIDTVVTDHHECRPELPDAVAVVNPHRPGSGYPFTDLAGVGVAYKLITALEADRKAGPGREPDTAASAHEVLLRFADLIAIGTVADVMQIRGENRMIVSRGIEMMKKNCRCGIAALIGASRRGVTERDITASFISFTLAPRLNAAGRMGNAGQAVELLLADDPLTARELAENLCEVNRQRQIEENRIVGEALEKLNTDISHFDDSVIVLDDDNWQQGVIGIVASIISERENKPAIMITFEGMQTPGIKSDYDVGKGSGRSVPGFNLVSALSACGDILERYGGHEQAAGLSVTRAGLPEFRRRLNEYAADRLSALDLTVNVEADEEILPEQITLKLAEDIYRYMEPCSAGNPVPTFILRDATVQSVRQFSGGRHTKFSVLCGGKRFVAIFYGKTALDIEFEPGDSVDMLFSLNINSYAGETSVQLILSDICYSRGVYKKRLYERKRAAEILAGAHFPASERYLPDRSDCVNLYNIISDMIKGGRDAFSDTYIMRVIRSRLQGDRSINYVKYKLLLAIFEEMGIFRIRQDCCVPDSESSEWCLPEDFVSVERVTHSRKVDLTVSPILRRITAQCEDDNFNR